MGMAAPCAERRGRPRARSLQELRARDPQRRTRRLADEPPRAAEGPTSLPWHLVAREHPELPDSARP